MAKTAAEPKKLTREYEIVPEYAEYDADGEPVGKPRPLYADDTRGARVRVMPGTRFVAELAEDTVIDRRGVEPREVPVGTYHVVASTVDIAPGCLTSMIRTGQAKPVK